MGKLLKTKKDKEQFLDWIGALQSGAFRQGYHALESLPGRYCCLGLGCVLFTEENKLVFEKDHETLNGCFPKSQPKAPRWLRSINDHAYKNFGVDVADMNDKGARFHKIADKLLEIYKDELI